MKPRTETLLRLLAVQAAWTYERMAGIGVGHASAPLLRDAFATRSVRERREAVARAADFFNTHPYLAGVAVGAVVKAERDGVPGAVISRLRTALSGPLGALGDQLIWAGWVPALVGFTLALAPWIGTIGVIAMVLVHNIFRWRLAVWGLDLGLREGLHVGAALQQSWLPTMAGDAQRAAAFAVGLAVPIVAWFGMRFASELEFVVTSGIAALGTALTLFPGTRQRITGLRLGLLLVAAATILALVIP